MTNSAFACRLTGRPLSLRDTPLNMAINGIFVTGRTVPAQFIDRIYVLQGNEWHTIGMMEVMACRITGNEGGAPQFTRAPAQRN